MLRSAHERGRAEALRQFGLKEAGISDWARSAWEGTKAAPGALWRGFTGDPAARGQLLKGNAFAPNGALHWKNVLWPTTGPAVTKWLGRAGTILPALEAYSALRGRAGDPHEGRLTNALSALGHAAGNAYGFPLGGVLGGGVLSTVGSRIGTGLGRVLGSKADPNDPIVPPPTHTLVDTNKPFPIYVGVQGL